MIPLRQSYFTTPPPTHTRLVGAMFFGKKTLRGGLYYMILIIYCLSPLISRATSFMPIITNYTAADYGGGLQNWALAQGKNGEMYIGNNTGLLCFDGYTWNKYQMPGNQLVRSILIDEDRIYVGTYEDFGYFSRNLSGKLEYTSLWNQIKDFETHNDEIWNILKVDGCIYFQSFSSWFKYDGQSVAAHYNPDLLPLYFHPAHGRIYMQMVNGGLYLLEDDEYKPVIKREELNDDAVVALIPTAGGSMILCTEWNGLYNYDGARVSPRPTAIDHELKNQQMNRAVMIPADSTIVLGTIRNGIYAIDKKGKEKWHYDVNNGLYNNSVLRLFCDRDNNVWAALDIGITLIHTGSPYSILIPSHDSPSFGMVYGVSVFNNNLYIATNQSAFLYAACNRTITPVQGTEGQNWHISTFDSQILLGNNSGTKIITGTAATNIPGTEIGSTCLRKCVINGQEVLIESSYYNLRVYRKEKDKWIFSNSIDGFRNPVRRFEVDHTGAIWAAHMSLGLYKIELSTNLKSVEKCIYIKALSNEENSASLMHVTKIRGRVVLSDNEKTYLYDDINQQIIPFDKLNSILKNGINMAIYVDDNTYWITDYRGYTLIKYENDSFRQERFVPSTFFGLECNENNNNVYVDGHVTYFCLNNGIGRLDMSAKTNALSEKSHLLIKEVTSLSQDYLPRSMPVSADKKANEKTWSDITFHLSYPNFNSSPLRFCYRITGNGLDIRSESADPVITCGNLGYGDYCFTASVKNVDDHVIGFTEYYFTKPLPFYLSIYAWVVYLTLTGLMVYFYSRWHAAKMLRKRNREFEKEKMQQDFKMLVQEHIIARQHEQLLESELQIKGKELASLALDAVVQRKAVENLKEVLLQQERKGTINKQYADVMLKQISGNMSEEEFWDIYHENFDMIHKNFFRNLRKKYPSLTASDLRFCALLRLNLSTKDIAQFTNLTIRGVETARYRIRKKLNIHGNAGIVDFLIDFE